MNKLLQAALKYRNDLKYSVIPVQKNKKPYIQWEKYQHEIASEEQIRLWWEKWPEANVGVVTGVISNLAVIDIDTDEGKEEIHKYLPDSFLPPTADTPSSGQHMYCTCPDENIGNNARAVPGCDLRANGGYVVAPPSMNGDGKLYVWLKGLRPIDIETPELPITYIQYIKDNNIYNSLSLSERDRKLDFANTTHDYKRLQPFHKGRRDEDIFHVANALIKGDCSPDMAVKVLGIIANSCDPPFPKKEIILKVQSAMQRAENRERNLAQDVRDYLETTKGYFRTTDTHRELHLTTKAEKKNLTVILTRLCAEGAIEHYGNQRGVYRKIETVVEEIDFLSAEDKAVDIVWPFDIQELFETYPKNIILIAGSPDAGKTALLLNFIEMNMDKHDIHYFSSEMGPQELKGRLSKFKRPVDSWTFKPKERASDFADVIQPDDINIIDYMEIHQEHYMIGKWIKDVFDKLNKGIAVIAIQKKHGATTGVGGMTTLEKPRLYITMEGGTAKIEKCKNWADPMDNPNGKQIQYKLVQGCEFIRENWWHKETK